MSSLLSELHFWTTQEDVIVKNSYYGAFKYYSKKETYNSSRKKDFCEQRGILWNPVNKRHNKLKDRLKEFEDYLVQNKIIDYLWKESILQLLLSTGLLVSINVNEQTGDIVSISFDKQLSAKLQVNIICDGTILGPEVICICNDGHVLGYGGRWKDGWLIEGGPRRRIHSHKDWLVVWGRPGSEHPQPWSPLAKDHQRANLHLYWLGLRSPELLAYKNTDGEPFVTIISKFSDKTIILVEQKVTQRGAVSVEVSTLELSGNILKTVAITSVPLQTQVSCCDLSFNENYLLICCIDNTLALLDRNRGSTKTVRASFIPTLCAWQKLGALVAICNEKGQLQYYDVALNCVKSQLKSEDDTPSATLDLSSFFHSQVSVVSINWDNTHLIVALEQGPLICVTHILNSLSFLALSKRYIYIGEVKKAIALLLSWCFCDDSFFMLQNIVSHLLKQQMTEPIAQQLQDALGFYHASTIPLSAEIRNHYGHRVFSLTRRYFHQLIRAGMYETAFLLAVDVAHHDLFMDLHFIAVKLGETEMAAAARAQASALVSRCSSEASNCSHSSCSNCSSPCENDRRDQGSEQMNKMATSFSDKPNDNLISTNFNQPETTKTYIVPSGAYEYPKLNPPRVNYVKPPQVPSNFNKPTTSANVPPLPFNFSLPNLLNSNLGIPLMSSTECQSNHSMFYPATSSKPTQASNSNQSSSTFGGSTQKFGENIRPSILSENTLSFSDSNLTMKYATTLQPKTFVTHLPIEKKIQMTNYASNSHLSNFAGKSANFGQSNQTTNMRSANQQYPHSNFVRNIQPKSKLSPSENRIHSISRSSFVPVESTFPPPLPVTHNFTLHYPPQNLPSQVVSSKIDTASTSFLSTSPQVTTKKPQSKVKFSDTVTAFIVPEVKRPVRPAPPPHVTDPQRELADSLPLCHPNEDYLKDFAPVRQNDNKDKSRDPPKIKVVHFGVV